MGSRDGTAVRVLASHQCVQGSIIIIIIIIILLLLLLILVFINKIHFEITGYPSNVIGSQQCDYSRIALSFDPNRIMFSANENGAVKQNSQSDFKAFLK